MTKSDYVLSQPQTRAHHCHWPGCERQVPPAMWGCKTHWFKLPRHIRDNIWRTFRPGQEKDWTPSSAYIEAAKEAQEWIAANSPNESSSPTPGQRRPDSAETQSRRSVQRLVR